MKLRDNTGFKDNQIKAMFSISFLSFSCKKTMMFAMMSCKLHLNNMNLLAQVKD